MDQDRRDLERRVREGDERARLELERARARAGTPVCEYQHEPRRERVCRHLFDRTAEDLYRRFTGIGVANALLCAVCAGPGAEPDVVECCLPCYRAIEQDNSGIGSLLGFQSAPQVLERPSELRFVERTIDLARLVGSRPIALAPVAGEGSAWLVLGEDGRLRVLDLAGDGGVRATSAAPVAAWDSLGELELLASSRGEFAVVVGAHGQFGRVVDVASGGTTLELNRGNYHTNVQRFSVALVEVAERSPLVVYATDWNRLEMSDARTGQRLTQRVSHVPQPGLPEGPNYLDYFHGRLHISPDQRWIADTGWVWAPVGIIRVWSLQRWLEENPFESESGPSVATFAQRSYHWDAPCTWIDNDTLAVWGFGDDDNNLIPAVTLFDRSGREQRWFAGPAGELFFDRHLVSSSAAMGTQVWDVATGERLLSLPNLHLTHHHAGSHEFMSFREPVVSIGRFV